MDVYIVIQTFRYSGKVLRAHSYKSRRAALKNYRGSTNPPVEGSKFVNTLVGPDGVVLFSDLQQEYRFTPAAKWYHKFV